MNVTVTNQQGVTIAQIEGELDGKTAPNAQETVLPLIQSGNSLLIDMSDVLYMSSAGLRMMLLIYRQSAASGGQLVLTGLSEEISETMELTGFLDYFQIQPTIADGLALLAEA